LPADQQESNGADPARAAADAAGLRYVSDAAPGIRRRRSGAGFAYLGPDGRRITDAATLARIRALAVPPAWSDVWICPRADGHVQATGRDERGRKQYRYHPRWREVRDETKYERLIEFARALPAVRARVEADMALPGLPRQRVLATVIHLLDRTLIRIGNGEYARRNDSHGLTTLRNRHVAVEGGTLRFRFRGKSGRVWRLGIRDRRVAAIVRACQELPGQTLFQYRDDAGEVRDVTSTDVNAYLRGISGADITAKDFRTWAGTVLAATALAELGDPDGPAAARRNVKAAIERVAARLGNTAAICRKCYVHPEVVESYLGGEFRLEFRPEEDAAPPAEHSGLDPEEAAVLTLLLGRRRSAADGPARMAA